MNSNRPRRIRYYLMKLPNYQKRMNKYGKVTCVQCGNPIQVGDACVSRKTHGAGTHNASLYDQTCAAMLYFIEDALHIPEEFWKT